MRESTVSGIPLHIFLYILLVGFLLSMVDYASFVLSQYHKC